MAASDGLSYSKGDTVIFQCDSGYSPTYTRTAVCTVGEGGGHLTQSLLSAVNHKVRLAPHVHQVLLIKIIIIIGYFLFNWFMCGDEKKKD